MVRRLHLRSIRICFETGFHRPFNRPIDVLISGEYLVGIIASITVLVDGEVPLPLIHIAIVFQAADVADVPIVVTIKIQKLTRDIEAIRVSYL